MVRYHRENCNKSQGRSKIKERWREAWKKDTRPPVHAVLHDGSAIIQRISQFRGSNLKKPAPSVPSSISIEDDETEDESAEQPTTQAVYQDFYHGVIHTDEHGTLYRTLRDGITMFNDAICASYKGRNVGAVVLCFDKQDYVPVSKGQTQKDRSKEAQDRIDSLPPLKLELDMRLTSDWNDYLSMRGLVRKKMIRYIVRQILNPNGVARISWTTCCTLYVDGHCLRAKDLAGWNVVCKDPETQLEEWDDPQVCLNDYPICMRIVGGRMQFHFEKRMRNQLGEFDYGCFYLSKVLAQIAGVPESMEIVSVDTDMMYLGLTYLYKTLVMGDGQDLPQVYVRDGSYDQKPLVLDANHLMRLIDNDPKLQGIRGASMLLCFTMQLGGSDYTDGHYFINHEKVFQGFLECANKISQSVVINDQGGVWIYASGYMDFILYLYRQLHKSRIPEKEEVTWATFNSYLGAVGKKKALDPNKYLPSEEDCIFACKQWIYMCNMMFHVGEHDIDRLHPLKYGHVKIDEDKPISKDNIKRKIIPETLPNVKQDRKPREVKKRRFAPVKV